MQAFASAADVAARMARPFPDEATERVEVLCADASDMIRERWPDVDARIASGALMASSVQRIVATMVRRAVQNENADGVASIGQGVGPWNTNVTYSNPDGSLYIFKSEAAVLDGDQTSRGKAFTVDQWQTPAPDWCGW